METFVLLLIMAAISLFNWLIKKSADAREAKEQAERESQSAGSKTTVSRPSHQTTPPVAKKSEEERLREFMEALGVPKDKLPRQLRREEPPPTPQQPERKPTPTAPPPLRRETPTPRRKQRPSPVVQQPAAAEPAHPAFAEIKEPPEMLAPVATDAYKIRTAADRAASVPAVALRELLVSRNGFRTALLMHEIIGPPRGLRPPSDLPGLT
jgi:hypothetical protein